MSDINTPVEQVTDDLDSFSNDFFGQKSSEPASSTSETEIDDQEKPESDVSNTDDTPQETDEPENNDDDDGDEGEKPTEKPKKNRFQERIDELTGGKRQAERERDELLARIRELENTKNDTAPTQKQEPAPTTPKPDDKFEDGSDKYPLGEFDPAFISDLTDFKLEQRLKSMEQKQVEQRQQEEQKAQQTALQQSWNEQLGSAQERYPDLMEKAQALAPTFDGIDQDYGEYLATTLMQMDKGADVLYYLANNPDEAAELVKMSPTKATLTLGRIESRFEGETKPSTPVNKVTQAPTPPPANKGAAAVQSNTPDDTDDLDAFAKKFFKKRR